MKQKPLFTEGDKIAIIAPSGSLTKDRLITPIKYLESLGIQVQIGKNVLKRDRYLAGSIDQRLEDLYTAFENPQIKAVFIARGGVGSTQLLPHIDYRFLKKYPKPFFGISDSTALQIALYQKAHIPSITGLSLCSDFTEKGINLTTKTSFLSTIHTSGFSSFKLKSLKPTKSLEGIFVGGCLTLIISLAGTDYQCQLKDKILFLEDIREEPYRIDRMLTQLSQLKDFFSLKAIVFGHFYKCEAENKKHGHLNTVIKKFAETVNIPIFTGLPYGHQPARYLLPIGIKAKISSQKRITFESINF